jgi:DNA repair exonuclease SbcCD ATPase subunit
MSARRLEELQVELERLAQARQTQETLLANQRQLAATLAKQERLVDTIARQRDAAASRLNELESRLASRQQERQSYAELLARAPAIQADYATLQVVRTDLERWEAIAERFREQEKRRQEPLDEINAARAALKQEQQTLEAQGRTVEAAVAPIPDLEAQLAAAQEGIMFAEARLDRRSRLDAGLQNARQSQAEARREPTFEGRDGSRSHQPAGVEGAVCPVCGQPLNSTERQALIDSLTAQVRKWATATAQIRRCSIRLTSECDLEVQIRE